MNILLVFFCFANLVSARLIGADPKTWSPKVNDTWVPIVEPVVDKCTTCKMFVSGVNGYLEANSDKIKKYVPDKFLEDIVPASYCEDIGLCEDDEIVIFNKKIKFVVL